MIGDRNAVHDRVSMLMLGRKSMRVGYDKTSRDFPEWSALKWVSQESGVERSFDERGFTELMLNSDVDREVMDGVYKRLVSDTSARSCYSPSGAAGCGIVVSRPTSFVRGVSSDYELYLYKVRDSLEMNGYYEVGDGTSIYLARAEAEQVDKYLDNTYLDSATQQVLDRHAGSVAFDDFDYYDDSSYDHSIYDDPGEDQYFGEDGYYDSYDGEYEDEDDIEEETFSDDSKYVMVMVHDVSGMDYGRGSFADRPVVELSEDGLIPLHEADVMAICGMAHDQELAFERNASFERVMTPPEPERKKSDVEKRRERRLAHFNLNLADIENQGTSYNVDDGFEM